MTPIVPALVTTAFVAGTGLALDRLIDGDTRRAAGDRLIAVLALGIAGAGALVFVLGLVHLYRRPVIWTLAGAGIVVIALRRTVVADVATGALRAFRRDVLQLALPILATVGTYTAVVDLAMRAPVGGDEGDYKWFTPLQYALHHGIVRVDHRLSNGLFLSELLVVPAAVFHQLHAARLVQLLAVVLLALSARAIARRLGGAGVFAPFATIGSLVVAAGAVTIGSDNLVAALLAAAWLLVTRGDARSRVAGGMVLAAAVTTKQFIVLLLPLFLVLAWLATRDEPVDWSLATLRRRARPLLVAIVLPTVVVVVIGLVQTWQLVGSPVDRFGLSIYRSGDVHVRDGRAAGRIPSAHDLLVLPAVPLLAGLRSAEPSGRRAGILLPVGIVVAAAGLVLARRDRRRGLVLASATAAASFLLVAPVFVKTRFLVFTWAAVFVAADVAIAAIRARSWPRMRVPIDLVTQLVLLAGFADATRWILERYWWAPGR